jgi:type I restriction enzyme S subunit
MKDSGVSWIGEIPAHWEAEKLKKFTQPSDSKSKKSGIPYVGLESIESWNGRYKKSQPDQDAASAIFSPKGSLLFSKLRPYLAKSFIAKEDLMVTSELFSFSTKKKVNPSFLHYVLLSHRFIFFINNLVSGTKMPRVDKDSFFNQSSPIPPPQEQEFIVAFLDRETRKIDAQIDLLRKKSALLVEYRKAVIFEAVTMGTKDTNFSEWTTIRGKKAIKAISGGTTIKGTLSDTEEPNLFPAYSASGQDVWAPFYEHNKSAIVLSSVGARCGKAFKADGKWTSTANTSLLFAKKGFDRDYLWYMVNNEEWWDKGGTAQPFIQVSKTLRKEIRIPSKEADQSRIAKWIDSKVLFIDKQKDMIIKKIDLLLEYRKALIFEAVTGKIDLT